MISTEELYNSIECFLFAFTSKEEVIKVVFNNDLDSFTKMEKEDIDKKVNKNLGIYFKKKFEDNKLPELIEKYIEANGSALSKNDMKFLSQILIGSKYELTYEDLDALLEIKELSTYLRMTKNDNSLLVEKLREFQETEEYEEELKKEIEEVDRRHINFQYEGEDIVEMYYAEISKYPLLTVEEEKYYIKKYQEENDQEAFNMLVCCNQKLCVSIAKKYLNRGLEFLDLVQEGNFGLIKAIKRMDLNRKTKFSTPAVWWIRQKIGFAIEKSSSTIYIPKHQRRALAELNEATEKFGNEHFREPTIEELSEITGYSVDKIKEIRRTDISMYSIDERLPGDADSDLFFIEVLKDDIETPQEIIEHSENHKELDLLLKRLGNDTTVIAAKRKEQVLRLRMGIELYNEETYKLIKNHNLELEDRYRLKEIGKIYGVTYQRIAQIEKQGIRELKKYVNTFDINKDAPKRKRKKKSKE